MIHTKMLGKRVLIRTYSAGVHFGTLKEKEGQSVRLENVRRIWYWSGANSLSQIAMEGSTEINNCKIAMVVNEIILEQVIEIIPLSDKAAKILTESNIWKK